MEGESIENGLRNEIIIINIMIILIVIIVTIIIIMYYYNCDNIAHYSAVPEVHHALQ